jgi:hypothetical protein
VEYGDRGTEHPQSKRSHPAFFSDGNILPRENDSAGYRSGQIKGGRYDYAQKYITAECCRKVKYLDAEHYENENLHRKDSRRNCPAQHEYAVKPFVADTLFIIRKIHHKIRYN